MSDKRDHDFRDDFDLLCCKLTSGFHYCPHLHLINLWVRNTEATTSMTEHRIELMKEFILGPQLFNRHAHFGCEFLKFLIRMGKKLVKRRVEQSDRDRI